MKINQAVTQRIKKLCKDRGWTISELIRRSGVHQPTMSEIMAGRSKHPRIITIKKVSDGFGITLSDFFNDELFMDLEDE